MYILWYKVLVLCSFLRFATLSNQLHFEEAQIVLQIHCMPVQSSLCSSSINMQTVDKALTVSVFVNSDSSFSSSSGFISSFSRGSAEGAVVAVRYVLRTLLPLALAKFTWSHLLHAIWSPSPVPPPSILPGDQQEKTQFKAMR